MRVKIIVLMLCLLPVIIGVFGCQSSYPWDWYGMIKGKVTDSLGTPIAGVKIEAVGGTGTVLTGSTGLYELRDIPTGDEIVIMAIKPGYQTGMLVKTIGIGQVVTGINFVLRPEYLTTQ
ncbi:carboxypeptidase regulatory-like domain-containing protein [bacterium]|nr:carboxypeptidase regulatory-like domain-containing protein [bacterium]